MLEPTFFRLGNAYGWQLPLGNDAAFARADERLADSLTISGRKIRAYVPWGEDNLLPERILRLFTQAGGNAIYEGIKTRHRDMIAGKGFEFTGPADQVAAAKALLTAELLQVWAFDLAVFDAFGYQVIYSQAHRAAREAIRQPVEGQPMPADIQSALGHVYRVVPQRINSIRVATPSLNPQSGEMDVLGYYVSNDWVQLGTGENYTAAGRFRRSRTKWYSPVPVAKYGISDAELDKFAAEAGVSEAERTYFDYRALRVNQAYHIAANLYPKADAESILADLELPGKVVLMQNASLDNGQYAHSVIVVDKEITMDSTGQGISEEEMNQQRSYVNAYRNAMAGSSKAGQATFLFYDSKGSRSAPQILEAPKNDNDKKFLDILKMVDQRTRTAIGAGHGLIYGIPDTQAGFSSQSEAMQVSMSILEAFVLGPRRERILDEARRVLAAAHLPGVQVSIPILKFLPEPPAPATTQPSAP